MSLRRYALNKAIRGVPGSVPNVKNTFPKGIANMSLRRYAHNKAIRGGLEVCAAKAIRVTLNKVHGLRYPHGRHSGTRSPALATLNAHRCSHICAGSKTL